MCLWAVAGLGVAGAGEDAQAEYETYLREGVRLLREGNPADNPKAMAKFRAAYRHRSQSGEVDYWMALARYDYGVFTQAEEDARNAVRKGGDQLPEASLLLGQCCLVNRKFGEGIEHLRRAERLLLARLAARGQTEQHPDRELILARYNLGRGLYHRAVETPDLPVEEKNRDLEEAFGQLTYAIHRLANDDAPEGLGDVAVEAELYRGHCYAAGGQWSHAASMYREAFRKDEPLHLNSEPAFRLGLAYRRAQRYGEAYQWFQYVNERIAAYNRALPTGARRWEPHAEAYLQLGTLCLRELPQLPTAWAQLRLFLESAGPRHPWYGPVRDYLVRIQLGATEEGAP